MKDLGLSKHHLTSRHQLMSVHQLIKLLRLTRLPAMSAINSVSSDQRFDHARDRCHASIKSFAIVIVVRCFFLPTLVSLLDIYIACLQARFPSRISFCSSELVRVSML
jgi:hypothetical protein